MMLQNKRTAVLLRRSISDLKKSWYFRFWVVLWFIAIVVWLAAVGVLGKRADDDRKHQVQQYYITNEQRIAFPRYHLRVPLLQGQDLQEPTCFYGAKMASVQFTRSLCMFGDVCISVNGPSVSACVGSPPTDQDCNNRLVCVLRVTGKIPLNEQARQIAFELEDSEAFGSNSGSSIWISPGRDAWVLLTKGMFNKQAGWDRALLYHSVSIPRTNSTTPLEYQVTAVIDSFSVDHYETMDTYTGWMAVADMGGFLLFLWIFHSLCMLGLGICFENNSLVLTNGRAGDQDFDMQKEDEPIFSFPAVGEK